MKNFRILLGTLCGIISLPVIALVIVSLLPEKHLIELTEDSVEQFTDYSLSVNGFMTIDVWALEPSVALGDFEVRSSGAESPLFSSKLSRIKVDLLATVMGEPTLASIHSEGSSLHVNRIAPRKEPISAREVHRTLEVPFLRTVGLENFKIFYSESQYPKNPGIFIKAIHLGSDDSYEARLLQGSLSIAETEFLIKGKLASHYQMLKGEYHGSVSLRSKPDGNHHIDLQVEPMANPSSYSVRLEGKGPDFTPYSKAIEATFEGGTMYDFSTRSVWMLPEQVIKISEFSFLTSFVDVSVAGQLDYKQFLRATIDMDMRNFDLEFFKEKFTDVDSGSLESPDEPRKLLDDEHLPILPFAYMPLGSFDVSLNFKDKPLLALSLVERNHLMSMDIKNFELRGADGPHLQGRGKLSIENQRYHLSGNITVPGYDLSGLNHMIKNTVEDESKVDIFNDQTAIAGKVFLQQQFSTFGSSLAGFGDHLSGKGVAAVENGHIHSIIIEPLNLDILESAASIFSDNSVIEMECSYGKAIIENGVLKFEEAMIGTQDSNIFIKGLIDFKKQGLWIRLFPKVKDKSITGIKEKILVSGPIHEPSLGLYRDGKEVTDTSVWDWASSFFQGMFENVQDLLSDPNLEPKESGICNDYRQRIDLAKGKVLSH